MLKLFRCPGGLIAAVAVVGLAGGANSFGADVEIATTPAIEVAAQKLTGVAPVSGEPTATVADGAGHSIHILPTENFAPGLAAATDTGPLLYHAGGSIMPRVTIYTIFWKPAKLQNGSPAVMAAGYQTILNNLAADYVGHDIASVNTQYYQTIGGVTTYVSGLPYVLSGVGSEGGTYADTNPYPASGCKDSQTPGNCITDAQLLTELVRVMKLEGWTGGMDKIYLMFTAQNEGSCFTSASTSCAYVAYCAYHSAVSVNSVPVIYANMPYGNTQYCVGTGTSPNANPVADAATTAMSHEVSEAITDPLLNAWFTAKGSENGDLCAYNYGTNQYDKGLANQSWNGHFYELQKEYDNHAAGCVLTGP